MERERDNNRKFSNEIESFDLLMIQINQGISFSNFERLSFGL